MPPRLTLSQIIIQFVVYLAIHSAAWNIVTTIVLIPLGFLQNPVMILLNSLDSDDLKSSSYFPVIQRVFWGYTLVMVALTTVKFTSKAYFEMVWYYGRIPNDRQFMKIFRLFFQSYISDLLFLTLPAVSTSSYLIKLNY